MYTCFYGNPNRVSFLARDLRRGLMCFFRQRLSSSLCRLSQSVRPIIGYCYTSVPREICLSDFFSCLKCLLLFHFLLKIFYRFKPFSFLICQIWLMFRKCLQNTGWTIRVFTKQISYLAILQRTYSLIALLEI